MARNSPLKYCLKDGKIFTVALATTDADHDAPTDLELEIVRVFAEWHEFKAKNKRLRENAANHHAEAAKFLSEQAARKEQTQLLQAKNKKLREALEMTIQLLSKSSKPLT